MCERERMIIDRLYEALGPAADEIMEMVEQEVAEALYFTYSSMVEEPDELE